MKRALIIAAEIAAVALLAVGFACIVAEAVVSADLYGF